MEVVEKVVRGEGSSRDSWAERIALLLHLAPLCVSVLNSISHECLQLGKCWSKGGEGEGRKEGIQWEEGGVSMQ